jgi:hypothetical protein
LLFNEQLKLIQELLNDPEEILVRFGGFELERIAKLNRPKWIRPTKRKPQLAGTCDENRTADEEPRDRSLDSHRAERLRLMPRA